MTETSTTSDRAARRRASRREENRTDILDAAESVFAKHGIQAGSVRKIAADSGFSSAALYLFFDSKQDLLQETVRRRGNELVAEIRAAASSDGTPLDVLHRVIDVTVGWFAAHPAFGQLLRHIRGGATPAGPALGSYERSGDGDAINRFEDVTATLAGLVRDGQAIGEIRAGDPRALAHFYEVLINEHVLLATSAEADVEAMTPAQFHDLVDDALSPTGFMRTTPAPWH
jgi:AcrR family transcriptional regulator